MERERERERVGTAHSAVEALQSGPATVIKSGRTAGSTVGSQPGPTTTTSNNRAGNSCSGRTAGSTVGSQPGPTTTTSKIRAGNSCYGGVADFFSSWQRFGIQFFLLTLFFYVTPVWIELVGISRQF